LTSLDLEFTGEPELPRTWGGVLAIRVAEVSAGPLSLQPVDISLKTKDGKADVRVEGLLGQSRDGQREGRLPGRHRGYAVEYVDATLVSPSFVFSEISTGCSESGPALTSAHADRKHAAPVRAVPVRR